jgi:hypothetical protein
MVTSKRVAFLLVPVLALGMLCATRQASAQCFGPDGLTGPCCVPVIPTLPAFPSVSMPGLGADWDRCTQGLQRKLVVIWPALAPSSCTEFSAPLTVLDQASGLPVLAGKMLIDFTRTWTEVDPIGNPMQVWRFTVKADLSIPPGALIVNCPTPPCLAPVGPHPTAFFYGYMDYAACNTANGFQNVLVLEHMPDRFIHAPGLSSMPGIFHPGQAYAIIAPHSAVQPFIPGNAIASGGPLFGEAVRDVNVPGIPPTICLAEDRIAQGLMTKLGAGCLANITTGPKQHTLRQLQGQTNCPTSSGAPGAFASLNISFPTLPWFHMVSTSLGTWSNPNVYPGKEEAWVDEGLFVQQDACTGDVFELKYGGSTRGGWQVLPNGTPPVTNFTDLVDNYTAPLSGPFPFPIEGNIMPSAHLIYVNEP